MTIRGNPDLLEQYTDRTLLALDPLDTATSDYHAAISVLLGEASTVVIDTPDRSGWVEGETSLLRRVDRRPAAFAFALRQLDHHPIDTPRDRVWFVTSDQTLFDALVDARLAHPHDDPAAVTTAALDALTGSPAALAAAFRTVIDQIDQSMGADDIDTLKFELLQQLDALAQANAYSDPPLTDEEMAQRALLVVGQNGALSTVPPQLVDRLRELTELLGRRKYEDGYTTQFFQSLGADDTALLPQAIALASWSDNLRTGGQPCFSIDDAMVNVDPALGTASPHLDQSWRDALFSHATHDGTLNDAFPLLFTYGQFAPPFAQTAGQLGLDVLHGTITVDRGAGSPGYSGFDVLSTHWEARGTVLVEAAARTPEAAARLLGSAPNADWATSDTFGRDGRHHPDWALIGPSLRDLVVSGTVSAYDTDQELARRAAATVMNAAIRHGPGDASEALAPAYGAVGVQYLPDLARSPVFDAEPIYDAFSGPHIQVGAYQAAQFLSLAMADEGARDDLLRLRDVIDMQIAVNGLNGGIADPVWQQRLANVDGIVLSAADGHDFLDARALDDAANQHNQNVDFLQSLAMSTIGLKFELPGPLGVIADRGLDELKQTYLYDDADNVERAGHTTSVAHFTLFDHQRLVIAEATLVVALRADAAGRASGDQRAFIDRADATLGPDYVNALRAAAGGQSVPLPAVDAVRLRDFAGYTSLDDFTAVSNYTHLLLPQDPKALWAP